MGGKPSASPTCARCAGTLQRASGAMARPASTMYGDGQRTQRCVMGAMLFALGVKMALDAWRWNLIA